jgi:hypothetical protein
LLANAVWTHFGNLSHNGVVQPNPGEPAALRPR